MSGAHSELYTSYPKCQRVRTGPILPYLKCPCNTFGARSLFQVGLYAKANSNLRFFQNNKGLQKLFQAPNNDSVTRHLGRGDSSSKNALGHLHRGER